MRSHTHAHTHEHGHEPRGHDTAFAVGTLLNAAFVVVEGIYGLIGHSMALLADAGHNLSDVATLLIAWAASALTRQRPSSRFTYGYRGSSILAALLNAVILFIAVGAIGLESVQRLIEPGPVASLTVIVVAAVGIGVNGLTTLFFLRGRHGDLNIRSAYLHMAADTLVSAGVVAAGAAIMATGWLWIDPVFTSPGRTRQPRKSSTVSAVAGSSAVGPTCSMSPSRTKSPPFESSRRTPSIVTNSVTFFTRSVGI